MENMTAGIRKGKCCSGVGDDDVDDDNNVDDSDKRG